MAEIVWLRRDLRRSDLPTLGAATALGGEVAIVFVLDPDGWAALGAPKRTFTARTLLATRAAYEGRLTLRWGDPVTVIPALAREFAAPSVHVSAETEPDGAARDARVEAALAASGVSLVRTGSPYAVTPGRVRRKDGSPYRVFTPFSAAWFEHGWRPPAEEPAGLRLAADRSDPDAWAEVERAAAARDVALPDAGEEVALDAWRRFLAGPLGTYDADRNRPDLDGTSRLSPHLSVGAIHPRTLLADLQAHGGRGADRFRIELAWREFYADVLHHHPASATDDLNHSLADLAYDEVPDRVAAWKQGRTGYPIVDAGMRQLLGEGWVHNRVRMVTASFLVKHLHTRWQVGAEHFLKHLADADLASNQHGWQWVAGTGTDAAPYFRVFNPTLQGERFDPEGDYVRRWVPELRGIPGSAVHQPWKLPAQARGDYPDPLVDLRVERAEALGRLAASRVQG